METDYIKSIRNRILEKLEDLKSKIITDEELPHGKQDLELLIEIDDKLEECLNNWYY